MTFGAPGYLAFAVLAVLAAVMIDAAYVWQSRARARFGAPGAARLRRFVPFALLVAAIGLAAFAAARPQVGDRDEKVERGGIDLVIVLDVSNSMLAEDVAANRLDRAQSEIAALLDRMEGDRVGLVIFAGRPFVRMPLTSDLNAVATVVANVHEERGLVSAGSDLGAAIREAHLLATQTEEVEGSRAILVISDGEDHGRTVGIAVSQAREAGVRVYAAGVGTEAGAPVIDIHPESGEKIPRTGREGGIVTTRLNPLTLSALAEAGDGTYIELRGEDRPLAGLAAEFESLARTTSEAEERSRPIEQFQWFAASALAIVAAVTLAPLVRRTFVAAPFARLLPVAGAVLVIGAVCADSAADHNRRGNEKYEDAEYGASVESYRAAQELEQEQGELNYNAGNALERSGDLAGAIDETKRALPSDDDAFAAIAEYALGNHYAASQQLVDAIESYKRALLADPHDEDAKHNLEVIAARLRATPTAIPTPQPSDDATSPPDGDATPGADGTPDTQPGSPVASPSPSADRSPGDSDGASNAEIERQLAEALAGIDEEFTVEEALRALELLEEQNRNELGGSQAGGPGAPDW